MIRKDGGLHIVFEYCQHNLYEELQSRSLSNRPFSEEQVRPLMFQALSAVEYVHRNGFMHRDIKPENFLLIQK